MLNQVFIFLSLLNAVSGSFGSCCCVRLGVYSCNCCPAPPQVAPLLPIPNFPYHSTHIPSPPLFPATVFPSQVIPGPFPTFGSNQFCTMQCKPHPSHSPGWSGGCFWYKVCYPNSLYPTVPLVTTTKAAEYCPSGPSIGPCVNGQCPNGYACAGNRCCPAPNIYGPCINGKCPMGICTKGLCRG